MPMKVNSVNSIAVLGAQWGDEGKGKIVDYLTRRADVVARFQGGNNAGHTVVVGAETFKMHHLPVGILHSGVLCLLGNGMVIDPEVLVNELAGLEERGVDTSCLRISPRAHVILPFHRAVDISEEASKTGMKIGTTGRGIGPAYADKAYRRGLRMGDYVNHERFCSWLEEALPLQNRILREVFGHPGFEKEEILQLHRPLGEKLAPYLADTSLLLMEHLQKGERILFEGAQGALLDIDHGTYPFVTSSNTISGSIFTGLGISPLNTVGEILGVTKAYTTRVGEGPYPTEEKSTLGDRIRERGREYGTTTGRPRRCGWFDAVVARYSARINGFTGWGVTKLDVMGGFKTLPVAGAYRLDGREISDPPVALEDYWRCEPVYQELPGWEEDISAARRMEQLPPEAHSYLQAMEDLTGVKIALVSVGPEREQTILVPGSSLFTLSSV